MSRHPYENLPDHAFWRRAVAGLSPDQVNPAIAAPFTITPKDRVATAGSCFAQHIGPMMRGIHFNHLVTEAAHPIFPEELAARFNYGLFSARYGNIYTARQLLQLWYRAYDAFCPREDVWDGPDGVLIDPFRPQIQPRDFLTPQEYERDRAQHFAAVRQMFETMDVFVFTLGLTECWRDKTDGAVFPLCPGVAGGVFDPARHEFHNFTVDEVVSDLVLFIDSVRRRNPLCRVILTVSPVPLVATARADTHVLAATSYSKSVLRVAAEVVAGQRGGVAYFPAYEIVTGHFGGAGYYDADCRTVTGAGVLHVLRAFAACFAKLDLPVPAAAAPSGTQTRLAQMETLMRTHCDEMALDRG
jgi:hypothetical protein